MASRRLPSFARCCAAAGGLAAATYGACVAVAFLRYGTTAVPAGEQADSLLDRFMPTYEVVERHHIHVAAPAAVTFASASETELFQAPLVRLLFRARERIMGAPVQEPIKPGPFLSLAKAMGWGVLAETPTEIVMGAVTQPWLAEVVFRPLPAGEFESFRDPGYVKIAWTIRADSLDDERSVFRTETRVIATDPTARSKFRRYWALASPGIILIRWLMLNPVKTAAERRHAGCAIG